MKPTRRKAVPEPPSSSPPRLDAPAADRVWSWLGSRACLALVLATAAALRVGHVLAIQKLPLDVLVLDSAVYDLWAERIASGDWLGSGVFYQDPLYPYFLAALYGAFGHDVLLVRLVQAGLGVGTCALVASIASRAAGRVAGNLAALILGVFLPAIFHEADVDKTALGMFLMTAALALGLRASVPARAGAGALLALAALTRGNLLLVAPLAAMVFALEAPDGESLRGSWRDGLLRRLRARPFRSAMAFVLAFAAVLAPVAWRNHHFSGEWIPTTYQAGAVFYTGNNPANSTGAFEHVPFVRSVPGFEESDFRAAAEARVGRRLSPSEISAFWFHEALRHIAERPGFAATVQLKKVALLLGDYEMPDAWDVYFLARYSPVLRLPLLTMAGLLALAMLGAVLEAKANRQVRLVAGFVVVYGLAVLAFFVFARYRVYAAPALAVLGGVGIASLVQRLRSGVSRSVVPAVAAAAALAFFSVSGIGTPPKREYLGNLVQLANLHYVKGEVGQATKLLAEALERNPNSVEAWCGVGRLHLEQGDASRAADAFRRCVAIDPAFPSAWHWIGIAELRLGNRAAAEAAFQRQLAIVPGHEESMRALAELRR